VGQITEALVQIPVLAYAEDTRNCPGTNQLVTRIGQPSRAQFLGEIAEGLPYLRQSDFSTLST
jgi:hypothetical protein